MRALALCVLLAACPASSDRSGVCAPWESLAPPLAGARVDLCTPAALAVTYPHAPAAKVRSRWVAWAGRGWRPVQGADLTWLGDGQSLSLVVEPQGDGAAVSALLSPTR